MKSLSGCSILTLFLYLILIIPKGNAFSISSSEEIRAKKQITEVAKSLDSLKDEFTYINLSTVEREEVDSQIYTLKKRIETLRPKDEYEWVHTSSVIENSYIDLLRNLHTYKVVNEVTR